MTLDVAGMKQGQRAMWSAGDYPDIARFIESAAEHLVERAGIEAGQDVLDVATGSGNVAILCAGRGARVTGLDLTPELFDAARSRASAAGVECEWVEGDAEELPYPDDSFDRVLSTFGVMFAPRHRVAAEELVRTCKPGGTIVLANWTPDGFVGQIIATVQSYLPPQPAVAQRATLWGEEAHLRTLLGGQVLLALERRTVDFVFPSIEKMMSSFQEQFGPMVVSRQMLEADRYTALVADLRALFERLNVGDGEVRIPSESLLVVGLKP